MEVMQTSQKTLGIFLAAMLLFVILDGAVDCANERYEAESADEVEESEFRDERTFTVERICTYDG